LKQKIATEMNLSETAFVVPQDDNQNNTENPFEKGQKFGLRWFTPTVEVPLCGHATLASATVLFYKMNNTQVIIHNSRIAQLRSAFSREKVFEKKFGKNRGKKLEKN
jgi:PhzF family phenazine biosynthesis protein